MMPWRPQHCRSGPSGASASCLRAGSDRFALCESDPAAGGQWNVLFTMLRLRMQVSALMLLLAWPALAVAENRWDNLADTVFQHLSGEQGLPHVIVTSLLQDREGFLWAGTQDGLARWDGYRFRTWAPNPKDAASIPDNYVQALFQDRAGRMWVGTGGNGLARYDAREDRFVRVPVGPGGTSHVAVLSMADDGAGGLWVGTLGGLDHLNANGVADSHWHARGGGAAENALPADEVRAMLRDSEGRLWLGTRKGLVLMDGKRLQPVRLPDSGGGTPYVRSLMQGSDGRIWAGTASEGVFVVDSASLQAQPVLAATSSGLRLNHDVITTIREVRPGQIWFGNVGQGLVVLDTASMQMRRLQHEPLLPTSLADNAVLDLLLDRSGLLWVATQRGISRVDPGQAAILSLFGGAGRHGRIDDVDVTSVHSMPDGRIRLGLHGGGIHTIDAAAQQMTGLRPDDRNQASGLPALAVHGFASLADGTQYVAAGRGLYRIDDTGSRLSKQEFAPLEADKAISAILDDGTRLIVGAEGGIWQLDHLRMQASRLPGSDALKRESVIALAQDRAGILWAGTRNSGLYRINLASGEVRHVRPDRADLAALSSGNIASLLFDRHGRLWIATQGGGIDLLASPDDPGKLHFLRFGTEDGLPNALINKLLEDDEGNIWASTDGGLALIDGETLEITPLRRADGVPIVGYWSNSGAKTAHGELLFGGTGGLTVVRPALFTRWKFQPPVMITELHLGGKLISAGRYNLPGGSTEWLEIDPHANSIAVEFAALDFSAPEQNRYAYRLDGYDTEWIEAGPAHRLAAYTNLPPGDYRLRLRASNRNGVWVMQERTLALRVLPAWHQTAWFLLAEGLIVLAVVVALVQGRTRYLRRKQHELESTVQTRTNELRQAQEQLVQQEKLASLGGLVVGIAHEINTPLGTTMMAISGALDCWERLRKALAAGRLSQSLLEGSSAEGLEYTELALRTASRAAELITSFKAISVQFESERMAALDLSVYLPEIAMLVRPSLEQSGHHLEIEVAEGLGVSLMPEALTEALTRVLANVLDHAFPAPGHAAGTETGNHDAGGGTLRLSARRINPEEVLIMVCDDGCGIAEADLPRVFDPFFTTKSGVRGHIGLGLHVAYNHVTQGLRGEISISSKPGRGTAVAIRIKAR